MRKRSAGRMQALLDSAPMGVYVVDSDFRLAAVNRTAMPVFGGIPDPIGREFGEVVHTLWNDPYADEVAAHFRHTLETGEDYVVAEHAEARRDTGVVEYYEWRIDRITVPGGQHAVVCYFKDISDSVRRREEFQRLSAESERQGRFYDTILSATPDLVYVFDLQHRFTYANTALLAMWGRTWEESIGKTCLELGYEPWHAARHDREIDQVIATRRPIRGEVPFTGMHGRRIYDYIFVPILGPDGEVEAIAGTTRDVTDRELARASLQRSEQLLSQIFDAAPAFMAVLRGADLVFEKANDAYRDLVGANRALIGRPLLDALPEIGGTPFPQVVRDVMESGRAYHGRNVRIQLRRKDDGPLEERWVDFVYEPMRDAGGIVSAVFVHGVDLTDRIVAEQALRDSEQRLRFVIDSIPQKIFTATPDGVVDYLNPAWLEYSGLTTEQLQDWTRFVHPDDLAQNVMAWRRSVASGDAFQFEQRFRRADGAFRWHITRAAAMKNDSGDVRMWIGSNTDIHEQREAANEMRSLASSLAESDRRKDEFLAVLAHELRNPLAPISNALQILRLSDGDAESARFATTVMDRQLGQLVRLVDDLLDVSRISRGKVELRLQPMDLASSVEQAVEAAKPLVDRMAQSLGVTLPAEPIQLHADPMRLAQVIGNLLTNASKFTDRNGRIDLVVERDGNEALVRVRDSGIGIAAEQRDRIFEMFTQLDTTAERSTGGLGIGLSLVRSLVEMHGGSVSVHSDGLGKGTEFVLRLPVRPAGRGDGGTPAERITAAG
jgi:PAS domain S-box-containing protein